MRVTHELGFRSSLLHCSGSRTSLGWEELSKRWEAMAAWWDMLFLTMSPFLHRVISCKDVQRQMTEGRKQGNANQLWLLVCVGFVNFLNTHLSDIHSIKRFASLSQIFVVVVSHQQNFNISDTVKGTFISFGPYLSAMSVLNELGNI